MFDGDALLTDSILPAPPDGDPLPLLHDREYRVRAYRLASDRILIQGGVRDQKPPGLYLRQDPEPLTVHHMQASIEISFPALEIVAARVDFETHPNETCPSIADRYGELVGLSIARGFTHRVRELLGGPRGCTHTTALLQAMAPVAIQCFWSMKSAEAALAGDPEPVIGKSRQRDDSWRTIVGSCHVWDPDGPAVAAAEAHVPQPIPVFMRARLEKLGIDVPEHA